jgi:hypothetical protein
MSEAISNTLSTSFEDLDANIDLTFSVIVIVLAAASSALSFSNRNFIEKFSKESRIIDELNRCRHELTVWKIELMGLAPDKYLTGELEHLEEKLSRLSASVNSLMNENVIQLPSHLDASLINEDDSRYKRLLKEYEECIIRICELYDLFDGENT